MHLPLRRDAIAVFLFLLTQRPEIVRGFVPTGRGLLVPVEARLRPCSVRRRDGPSRPSPSFSLAMHYGHSHSHSHHHHHEAVAPLGSFAEDIAGRPQWKRSLHSLLHRPTARFLLSVVCGLLFPAVVRVAAVRSSSASSFVRAASASREEMTFFLVLASLATFGDVLYGEVRRVRDNVLHLWNHLASHRAALAKAEKERVTPTESTTGPMHYASQGPTVAVVSEDPSASKSAANRVTVLGMLVNIFLCVGKAVVGFSCGSTALVADAGHSLSDLFSDLVTIWAVRIGRLPPDDKHPYGYGKYEAVGSLVLAFTLLGTGISIANLSLGNLWKVFSASHGPTSTVLGSPTRLALVMAGLSVFSKEWLYRITRRVGECIRSPVVIANAWHHRSDAFSSLLTGLSITLAMTLPSLRWVDTAAGILVAGMISLTGMEIMTGAVAQLTDMNDGDLAGRLRLLAEEDDDVAEVRRVRSRRMGSAFHVDLEVSVQQSSSTSGGEQMDMAHSAIHAIEERLRHRIFEQESAVLEANVQAHTSPNWSRDAGTLETRARTMHRTDHSAASPVLHSTWAIEEGARRIARRHPNVRGVGAVTVRYCASGRAHVDVNLQLTELTEDVMTAALYGPGKVSISPYTMSISRALGIAEEVKEELLAEQNLRIQGANVFLDLNEQYSPPLPSFLEIYGSNYLVHDEIMSQILQTNSAGYPSL